jgi:translation initiation factor 2B subunit (eIF-2B alpha/beta/delta family)
LNEHLEERCFKRMLAALVKGQPSMAPMLNLANRLLLALNEGWDRVREEIEREISLSIQKTEELIKHAVERLSPYKKFATVSYSSTIKRFLANMASRNGVTLLVSKGDPVPYGLRLADEVKREGVETVVTTDALLPFMVKQVEAVVIGADSVDGKFLVNGAGTFPLVLAAKYYGVPVFVLCGTEKFLPELLSRYHVVKDEPYPGNLEGHEVVYRIFDLTPVDLITEFITENGTMNQDAFKEFISKIPVSRDFHTLLEF